MLPSVGPCAIACWIAYLVIGDCSTVIGGQQIAPVLVTVSIAVSDCGGGRFGYLSCGVSISLLAQDITGIIISPGVGLIPLLVILPDQLVSTVVHIAGSVSAVMD